MPAPSLRFMPGLPHPRSTQRGRRRERGLGTVGTEGRPGGPKEPPTRLSIHPAPGGAHWPWVPPRGAQSVNRIQTQSCVGSDAAHCFPGELDSGDWRSRL